MSEDEKPAGDQKHIKSHLVPFLFKKGQSGNPRGRPKMPEGMTELRKLTAESYKDIIETIVSGNIEEIKAMAEDPEATGIQVAIALSFLNAAKKGDYATIEQILQRLVGKIPDIVRIDGDVHIRQHAPNRDELEAAFKKLDQDF